MPGSTSHLLQFMTNQSGESESAGLAVVVVWCACAGAWWLPSCPCAMQSMCLTRPQPPAHPLYAPLHQAAPRASPPPTYNVAVASARSRSRRCRARLLLLLPRRALASPLSLCVAAVRPMHVRSGSGDARTYGATRRLDSVYLARAAGGWLPWPGLHCRWSEQMVGGSRRHETISALPAGICRRSEQRWATEEPTTRGRFGTNKGTIMVIYNSLIRSQIFFYLEGINGEKKLSLSRDSHEKAKRS